MGALQTERGFTIIEMLVTIGVLSLFLIFLTTLYITNESQKAATLRRSAAYDIASTNLQKIPSKSLIPASTTSCDSVSSGGSNPNNLQLNTAATGSVIATNATSGTTTPTWTTANMAAETTTGLTLPTGVVQTISVVYPFGCAVTVPARITSTVIYGSDSVTRAAYIN